MPGSPAFSSGQIGKGDVITEVRGLHCIGFLSCGKILLHADMGTRRPSSCTEHWRDYLPHSDASTVCCISIVG